MIGDLDEYQSAIEKRKRGKGGGELGREKEGEGGGRENIYLGG